MHIQSSGNSTTPPPQGKKAKGKGKAKPKAKPKVAAMKGFGKKVKAAQV